MSIQPFVVVCAVNLGEISAIVIEHALAEAHRHQNVSLHFLTVIETRRGRFSTRRVSEEELQGADEQLRSLVRDLISAFVDRSEDVRREVRFHTRAGRVDDQIVELALEARADRIIIGRHADEQRRKTLGSVSSTVVNAAPCTVEIVQVADYERMEQSYEQCPECVQVREQSRGDQWFCSEHHEGRVPRLSASVSSSSMTPGWGMF